MDVLRTASFVLVFAMLPLATAQTNPMADQRYDAKRCKPKIVSRTTLDEARAIRVGNGEKPTGFDPIVAFTILESDEVIHARVKRSSGIADVDASALRTIRSLKSSKRPGCGVIEAEASVTVDFR